MAKDSGSNRRREKRQMVVCPAQLSTQERKNRLAITHNLSRGGTLVLSNSRFELGERLEVALYGADDSAQKRSGRVVRIEALDSGLQWRYAMAVVFDEPLNTDEQEVLEEMARK